MKRVTAEQLAEGMKLAKPIIHPMSYDVLLQQGVALSVKQIQKLKRIKPTAIFIEEGLSFEECLDKYPDGPVKQVYTRALISIRGIFADQVEKGSINTALVANLAEELIDVLDEDEKALLQLCSLKDMDEYSATHSINVSIYSLYLGKLLGFDAKQQRNLGIGALLHDIGKLKIPRELLQKPTRLDPKEYDLIRRHPQDGLNVLRGDVAVPAESRRVVMQHHERIDGSGYPLGLKGEAIDLMARCAAVADIYDAVTTDRCYRMRMLPHEGVEVLLGEAVANRLDAQLVEAFLRKIYIYPIGTKVALNNGLTGEVVQIPADSLPTRPTVRITAPEDRQGELLNLKEHYTVFIEKILA